MKVIQCLTIAAAMWLAVFASAPLAHAAIIINITSGGGSVADFEISGTVDFTGGTSTPSPFLTNSYVRINTPSGSFGLGNTDGTGRVQLLSVPGTWSSLPTVAFSSIGGLPTGTSVTDLSYFRSVLDGEYYANVQRWGTTSLGVQDMSDTFSIDIGAANHTALFGGSSTTHVWTPSSGTSTTMTTLNVSAVPEPTTSFYAIGVVVASFFRRRRRVLA